MRVTQIEKLTASMSFLALGFAFLISVEHFMLSKRYIILPAIALAGAAALIKLFQERLLRRERSADRIFMIYAREDLDRAKALYRELQDKGFHPWLDTEDVMPGQVWRDAILSALERSRVALVLVSDNLAKKEGFVQKELRTAMSVLKGTNLNVSPIIPVRLNDSPVPKMLSHLQWVDLFRAGGESKLESALETTAIGKNKQRTTTDSLRVD